jgi:hypothetical protein
MYVYTHVYVYLNISKFEFDKYVWQILWFERIFWFEHNTEDRKPSTVGPYASDLHEIGCKINRKTCPVVSVMVPRSDNAK